MAFFLRGIVNSGMPPKCRPFFSSSRPFSPSSAFLAASSTLNEISFDVPTVWRLMCAACFVFSSCLPMASSRERV